MNFELVSDVIYGLKIEFGQDITVNTRTSTVNLTSGEKNYTHVIQAVQLAVVLPVSQSDRILKSIGIHQTGEIITGDRQIIIENDSDCQIAIGDVVTCQNFCGEIIKIEDFQHAKILTVKEIKDRPIVVNELSVNDNLPLTEEQ